MLNLFLEWDRVFIFSRVLLVKIFLNSCPTSEINSIFNIKLLNSLFIPFSLVLKHVSFKSGSLHAIRDVTSPYVAIFTLKITLLIFKVWKKQPVKYHIYSIKLGISQNLMCLLMGTVSQVSNVAHGPIVLCFFLLRPLDRRLFCLKL